MRYEELTLKNLEEILDFYVESFNSPPWNDKWTNESARNRLSQMINCEGYYGLVLYEENEPIGMILGNHEYNYDGMDFHIKELCISHKEKGKGIGGILLNKFADRLKEKGIDNIYLLTSKTKKTEGFYKKHGYNTLGERVMMEKKL